MQWYLTETTIGGVGHLIGEGKRQQEAEDLESAARIRHAQKVADRLIEKYGADQIAELAAFYQPNMIIEHK